MLPTMMMLLAVTVAASDPDLAEREGVLFFGQEPLDGVVETISGALQPKYTDAHAGWTAAQRAQSTLQVD